MNSNWSYSPETPNLGQIRRFLEPCDLEIWRMTLKNKRAPLLSNIKLYASFHHHMWIQTGVTVRKRLSWLVTSVTLTFDLWPWPFAWTLRWSLVITPENFMMIRWWEHSQKGVTDRRTDSLSVCPSVRPSVCRRHGFRSISQVCFRISISNFICMLMVAIGRSLLIFSDVTFKMAAWRPYWIFWFPDSVGDKVSGM